MSDRKRKIVVVCGSRSDLKYMRGGINALRIAQKQGLIEWGRVDICSTHRNPEELNDNIDMYVKGGVHAIIMVAGKLAALFGNVDARIRNVLKNSTTRVIAVPLKGATEQASLAALYSVLEVPNHKMIFRDEFFHDPTTAFEYAISGDLPQAELEEQKLAECLTPKEAYELTRIRYLPEASYDSMIQLFEANGLFHVYTGKTRETFINPAFPDLLYIYATDRISIFDIVLNAKIAGKGAVLTKMTVHWLTKVFPDVPNHLVAWGEDMKKYLPEGFRLDANFTHLVDNMLVVKRTKVLKVEAIVRGYLTGSGFKDYKKTGMVCGIALPAGLVDGSEIPGGPIFTPSTKADYGLHDENISFEKMCEITGPENAAALRDLAILLYTRGRDFARKTDIIIADTKFEAGIGPDGELLLIDEVLTPDSSRFWPEYEWLAAMEKGETPPSLDKQEIRDAGAAAGVKENPNWVPPPELLNRTSGKYQKMLELMTGISQ